MHGMNEKLSDKKDHIIHPDDRAGSSGPWLETKLKDEKLTIHPQSGIAIALKSLQQLRQLILSKGSTGVRPVEELYKLFSEGYGADLLTKALHWGYDSGLRLSQEQWKYLISANPNIASPGQSSTERNKVWEIVIGSIAKTFCAQVDFTEPDLICNYEGEKIAVAAKVIYSDEQVVQNVRKGFKQAKAVGDADEIDAYFIFANIVNIYPFLDIFKQTAKSQSSDKMTDLLLNNVTSWCDRLPLMKEAKRLKEQTNKPVGVGFFIPFTLVLNGNPMPFFYVHMPLTWAVGSIEYRFAQKFLQACNVVLGYPHENADSVTMTNKI